MRLGAHGPPEGAKTITHKDDDDGTWVEADGSLVMLNEGGCNCTTINVRTLIAWLRENRPDLLL